MEMLAVVMVAVLRLVAVWNYDVGRIKERQRACSEISEFAEMHIWMQGELGGGHEVGEQGFEASVTVVSVSLLLESALSR
jgi:hypothetical protein